MAPDWPADCWGLGLIGSRGWGLGFKAFGSLDKLGSSEGFNTFVRG